MTNPEATLLKLKQNLNILQEREAKYAGNAPLELLNQIHDHQQAIDLTQQTIAGELDEVRWQELLKPLLLAFQNGQVINIEAQTYITGESITIQQFIGGQAPLAEELDFFRTQIGLENIRASNYINSQFEAYCNVWKSLQALRLAGDDLWEKANSENLVKFANQLRQTQTTVWEGEIFFEDKDRENLLRILKAFGEFRLGKIELIEIRSISDVKFGVGQMYTGRGREIMTNSVHEFIRYIEARGQLPNIDKEVDILNEFERYNKARGQLPNIDEEVEVDVDVQVQIQIGHNKIYKNRYEDLLEKIRISFKNRLSNR